MKSEAAEDISAGLASQEAPSDALSEVATKETPEEAEEEVPGDGDSSERGPLGCVPLPAVACCVCLELERVNNCVRSEKICILPILACLLSLALCTAGLKWVFVDKIFEYEPPTHLDLKRIGQDPIINSDFTQNPVSVSPSSVTLSVPGQPKVFVEGDTTAFEVPPSRVAVFTPTAAVTVHPNSVSPPSPKSTFRPVQNDTANQYTTLESNEIIPKTCKYNLRSLLGHDWGFSYRYCNIIASALNHKIAVYTNVSTDCPFMQDQRTLFVYTNLIHIELQAGCELHYMVCHFIPHVLYLVSCAAHFCD